MKFEFSVSLPNLGRLLNQESHGLNEMKRNNPSEGRKTHKTKYTELENEIRTPIDGSNLQTDKKTVQASEPVQKVKGVLKRSSRRRAAENKSILQNAIARKEKSLSDFCTATIKQNRAKSSEVHQSKAQSAGVKRTSVPIVESEVNSGRNQNKSSDSVLRRSQRTLSSDKGEGLKPCIDLVKGFLEKHELYTRTSNLCCCLENKNLYTDTETESQFCTAVDGIDRRVIGCSKLVDPKISPLLRVSPRTAFSLFCDTHRKRLQTHGCCSTCGVFCTKGEFIECPSKHYFHKECAPVVDSKELCPHCGAWDQLAIVHVTMHTTKRPVLLPVQKPYH